MKELQQILKYKFNKVELLQKAITHGSVDANVEDNYERLEFLGDRVLGVAVASLLYNLFPKDPEGNLSQRFVGLVCKETVAEVAKTLKLDEFMKVATEDLRQNENVLCDVCEAVIGAIYIDGGVDGAASQRDGRLCIGLQALLSHRRCRVAHSFPELSVGGGR